MKYDSSMTHFNKDILAALRYMLKDDSEITEKFSPNDGSPVPLRDYLKQKYGKLRASHIGGGMRYSCNATKGLELTSDTILNNPGDKNLTLSWSQTAKFIRDNWDEVFKKDKPKNRPLETLVKTFDETEITCPNWLPGKTLTYLEVVNGVHFECKAFSAEFCKFDDITNFFVQHCYKSQECPYGKDSAEKQPSYIDKLREEYPKVNERDDWFDEAYCPAELFVGKNVKDYICEECDYSDKGAEACQKCWRERCPQNISFIENEDFEKEYFEHYPAEADVGENVPKEKTICDDCINNDENCIKPSEDKCIGYTSESDTILNPAPESKPTYKDIFLENYPDFDVSRFDEFINSNCRYACAAEYFTDTDPFDCNNPQSCKKCWYSPCESNWNSPDDDFVLEDISDYLKTVTVPENESPKSTAETENQLIPQNAGEISETFNYAVLSAEMGDYLKRKEQQLKNEYMNFTANCGAIFAEAQEKLAGSNQYNGLFEKWINSMGFKKDTVYRMINVHKFCSSQIATSSQAELFDSLSKSLQYEIAKPSAPAELIEQVLSGDITTHKDYIALKKQLDEANKRVEISESSEKRVLDNYVTLDQAYAARFNELANEQQKNKDLEKRVKELESRPIDVAVQQDESSLAEIDRLKNELAKAQQEILNASFGSSTADSELLTDLYETLHGSALSAIRSCADFAEKNGGRFTSRFRSLAEVINDCINEMEEF